MGQMFPTFNLSHTSTACLLFAQSTWQLTVSTQLGQVSLKGGDQKKKKPQNFPHMLQT